MITLYLSCLVVGGVFVGLSTLGAVGKDVDVDSDVDVNVDADADVDADHALQAGDASGLVDGSQALVARKPSVRKLWLPILSFRFWTFGSAFFGLTGALLTMLTGVGAAAVAITSATTGVGIGTLSAWMVRWLRRPVGASVRLADYSGASGELLLPLKAGGVTRIKLKVQGRERTMLAVAPEPLVLPTGTRVLVLGIDDDGRAQIEPEQAIYNPEE